MDIIQEIGLDPVVLDFLQKFTIAFMIGLLIGIERERRSRDHIIFAGVRSYCITCLTGMIATYVSVVTKDYGILYITALFFALICSIITTAKIFLFKRPSVTSPLSVFYTFILGVLVGYGYSFFAISCAIVLTFLLIQKKPLHQFAENISKDDLINAVQFLIVAFILYPIMPDRQFLGLVNLKSALLIVVLVSLISFFSYLLLKKFGNEKGFWYSGFFGGFVNSEATTAALAGISRKTESMTDPILTGILLCNASMLIRNLLIAVIVDPSGRALLLMLPPHIVIILISLALVIQRTKKFCIIDKGTLQLESPFSLGPAFKFGAAFTLVLIIANTANQVAGTAGIYVTTALGSLVSSSAVIVSVILLAANGSISYTTAANTAVLASMIGTANKILFAKISGSRELFLLTSKVFGMLALTGIAVLLVWSSCI